MRLAYVFHQSRVKFLRTSKFWEDHFENRQIDIFFSDGYGDPGFRTIFFCVTGSPNKLFGYISQEYLVTNRGKKKHGLDLRRWQDHPERKLVNDTNNRIKIKLLEESAALRAKRDRQAQKQLRGQMRNNEIEVLDSQTEGVVDALDFLPRHAEPIGRWIGEGKGAFIRFFIASEALGAYQKHRGGIRPQRHEPYVVEHYDYSKDAIDLVFVFKEDNDGSTVRMIVRHGIIYDWLDNWDDREPSDRAVGKFSDRLRV